MPAHRPPDVQVRPATPDDREFLCQIAPRLLVGYAPWRDADRMQATMAGFLLESLEAPRERGMMYMGYQEESVRLVKLLT